MTINLSDNSPRISYTVASGVTQSSFTVPFEFFSSSDLNVYVDGVQKTITADYTVSGGNGTTGSIAMSVTGISGGSTIVITRAIDLERTTDFPTSGPFDVSTLNTELDKIIAIQSDLKDQINRAITVSDYDEAGSLVLPSREDRKGKFIAFNATTGDVEAGASIASTNTVASVAADIETLADVEDGTVSTNAISNLGPIAADITTAAGVASDISTVAADILKVSHVSNNMHHVQNAAQNALDAQDALLTFQETFVVSAFAPTGPDSGDLWYDSVNETLRVYSSTTGNWELAGTYLDALTKTHTFTASSNQTNFTTDDAGNTMLIYAKGNALVFKNGIRLVEGSGSGVADYYWSGNTMVLNSGAVANDVVYIEVFTKISTTQEAALDQLVADAETAETNAAASATAAASSAASAASSATNASASEAASASSEAASASSESAAAASQTAAASSASSAAASATTATTKAGEASTSASNAATSEGNASTSASNAATSASNAASSASSSATSASNAATSESNAAASQSAAAASESAASSSESNAASSASSASTSASNAATSASNAATSASAASASQSAAASSASAASSSQSAAAASESAAAASESAAAASESAAASSETNAASSASSASTSASNAATSASNAATSANAASSSASSAASAQSAAESARDSALAAFDSFDDRYLGAFSSNPSTDNDGDSLVAGALYYNTTSDAMQVYTGSGWTAAYVSGTGFAALSGATFTGDITVPNIIVSGNVDGRDVSADGTKLDGIETGATADQTAAEIKTAYESNTNTNAFTDALQSKLNGIEASADVTDTTNVVAALTAGSNITIAANGTISATDTNTTYSNATTSVSGLMSSSDKSKLDGIEASADVTDTTNVVAALTAGSNITIAANGTISATDTNTTYNNATTSVSGLMSSTDKSKLDGIESGATGDQTASEILTLIKTVDGAASGLDADTLDGQQGSYYYAASNPSGYVTSSGVTSVATSGGLTGGTITSTGTLSVSSDCRPNSNQYFGNASGEYTYYDNTNALIRFYINSVEEFRMVSNGDFHADGDVIAYSTTISDERLKTDITKIDSALDKVGQLNGYTFTYKQDGKQSAGVIAQEVEKVLPSAVSEKELPLKTDDGVAYKTVQYDQLVGLLIEAVNELTTRVKELEARHGND